MNPLQEAIEEYRAATAELAKRVAAKKIGAAIGTALGASATLWRSDTQIDGMTLAEIEAWVDEVEAADIAWPEEGDGAPV